MVSARQAPGNGADALARLGWHDFEHLLAEYYRDQGYHVEHHAPAPSLKALESGLDLRLRRDKERVIVQCRHWDADEVQLPEVNELIGTMLNEAATAGVLVTRGSFSREARAVMRQQPRLRLIDGDILRVMLKLPDHLELSLPAQHRRTPNVSQRRSVFVRWLPVALLVLGILALLGLFAWMTMSDRHEHVAAAGAGSAVATDDALVVS